MGHAREKGREGGLRVSSSCGLAPYPQGPRYPWTHSLADEGPLWDGLQGSDAPAHLGCSVELQSDPGGGREGDVGWMNPEVLQRRGVSG